MNQLDIYSRSLDSFVLMMRHIEEERNRRVQRGELINIFSLWNSLSGITEPIHSRILQFFLSDNPMHGQGFSFLRLFLKCIGIDSQSDDEWVVTAETGRVDIMIKRFHPRSVVIIENKSNWAGDQPNQLYRYWYQNIHRCNEDCKQEYYHEHPEYKIVYLIPDSQKIISNDSLAKPHDYPEELPDILPIKPIFFSFKEGLSNWLEECISSLPRENSPLINLLTQYKEYCKAL